MLHLVLQLVGRLTCGDVRRSASLEDWTSGCAGHPDDALVHPPHLIVSGHGHCRSKTLAVHDAITWWPFELPADAFRITRAVVWSTKAELRVFEVVEGNRSVGQLRTHQTMHVLGKCHFSLEGQTMAPLKDQAPVLTDWSLSMPPPSPLSGDVNDGEHRRPHEGEAATSKIVPPVQRRRFGESVLPDQKLAAP